MDIPAITLNRDDLQNLIEGNMITKNLTENRSFESIKVTLEKIDHLEMIKIIVAANEPGKHLKFDLI